MTHQEPQCWPAGMPPRTKCQSVQVWSRHAQRMVQAYLVSPASSEEDAVSVVFHLPGVGWCKKQVPVMNVHTCHESNCSADEDGVCNLELQEVDVECAGMGAMVTQPFPKLVVCNFANLGWSGGNQHEFDWSKVCVAVTHFATHGHRVFGVTFSSNRHRVPECVKRRCEQLVFVDRNHHQREQDDEECIRLAHKHDGYILDNDNYRNFCCGQAAHRQWFMKMRQARSLGYFFHREVFHTTNQLPRLPGVLDPSSVVILVSLLDVAGDPVWDDVTNALRWVREHHSCCEHTRCILILWSEWRLFSTRQSHYRECMPKAIWAREQIEIVELPRRDTAPHWDEECAVRVAYERRCRLLDTQQQRFLQISDDMDAEAAAWLKGHYESISLPCDCMARQKKESIAKLIYNRHVDRARQLIATASRSELEEGTPSEESTPLHAAAFKGFLDIVIALVERQVNVNAINHFGKTPLCEAIERKHSSIADYLKEHGGVHGEQCTCATGRPGRRCR